jgi:Phytanoyl-CoA dioxygenase (PhyH)
MRFSAEEAQVFFDHGVVVRRGLFRPDEVTKARSALERLFQKAQTLEVTGDHDGAFFVISSVSDQKSAAPPRIVHRVVWAGGAEPDLLRLSEDPRLLTPALDLLGTPHCEQLICQAHYKMPNDGVAFDWHQDIQHRDKGAGTWRDVNGRGSFVQTILLIDDMTTENGPLEFLPLDAVEVDGDHRLRLNCGVANVDASRSVSITGHAGDVLFFGPYAVHGSTPNHSSSPRRVLINGYAAPGANARVYPGRGSCRRLPK